MSSNRDVSCDELEARAEGLLERGEGGIGIKLEYYIRRGLEYIVNSGKGR